MFDASFVLCDPSDEAVEGNENGGRTRAAEGSIPVNVAPSVDCVDLFQLPEGMKGHQTIGFCDVRLPN
jgi:hypothetical protein